MAQTLRKLEIVPDQRDPGEEPEELPTNQLNSSRLHSAPLTDGALALKADPVDWVNTLSNTQTLRSIHRANPISSHTPPTGMYLHVLPARMVPARRNTVGSVLKKASLFVLLPLLALGGAAWGVYAAFGTQWIADIFTPAPPTANTQISNPPVVADPSGAPVSSEQTGITTAPLEAGSPDELRDRGIERYKAGDYNESIRLLESAIAASSDDARVYYQLGLSYLGVTGRAHSVDDAELAFRTAASLQPEWAAAHNMLAESLIRGGYHTEAIGPALEATRLEPTMSEAWLTLSRAYKGAGKEADATRAYAQASKLSPAPPE